MIEAFKTNAEEKLQAGQVYSERNAQGSGAYRWGVYGYIYPKISPSKLFMGLK